MGGTTVVRGGTAFFVAVLGAASVAPLPADAFVDADDPAGLGVAAPLLHESQVRRSFSDEPPWDR